MAQQIDERVGTVNHCPGCGAGNIDKGPHLIDDTGERIYDVLCRVCGWTGDVSPDHSDGVDA